MTRRLMQHPQSLQIRRIQHSPDPSPRQHPTTHTHTRTRTARKDIRAYVAFATMGGNTCFGTNPQPYFLMELMSTPGLVDAHDQLPDDCSVGLIALAYAYAEA